MLIGMTSYFSYDDNIRDGMTSLESRDYKKNYLLSFLRII